jgi:serine/threonine protein kinase
MASEDVAASLKRLTEAYVHERELLERCSKARLSKVVLPLAHGQVTLPGHLIPVNYLIFERAEGDVRDHFAVMEAFDLAWVMRVLHDTAVGIQQLHGEGIAHQDVKPSNLVTFSSGATVKIADLERGEHREMTSPHADAQVAGDWTYAPPEHLYGSLPTDWATRRRSCDLYHLGSMICFFFLGMATTPAILARLQEDQYPVQWGDSYEAILPFVRDAFDLVALALDERLPPECRDRLGTAFRELCDPEPARRGSPKAKSQQYGDPFSVARYVSLFDLVAKRAERHLRAGK